MPNPSVPPKAPHDSNTPPALIDFMLQQWKPQSEKLPSKLKNHQAFYARRRLLSKRFPGEILIIPTGPEKVRANDTTYRFRPGSDFYYLTGNQESDCVLVLLPLPQGEHRDVLFVEPNPGRSDATFYTDRSKGELWVGARLGVERSRHRYQIHECRGLTELTPVLQTFSKGSGQRVRILRGHCPLIDATVTSEAGQLASDRELAEVLSEFRLYKDAQEVRELSTAIKSTHRGFEDVIRGLKGALSEREVEGVFNLRARMEGNDVGYNTIAASGSNACVLHWTRNDGTLRSQDLLLLDAGVEGHSLYTADITRTLPIGGKFSLPQREIYTLVYAAQHAAFEAVRPGNDFMAPHRAAMQILAQGLERLGILANAEDALKDEHQFYKRYSLHNVSHMLGIDVHDCAKARQEVYKFGTLKPGMVLTVEPGLYFQRDDLSVPPRYRGIGVRIEDDVLVTGKGCRNLSANIPSELGAVEAWMARLQKGTRSRR